MTMPRPPSVIATVASAMGQIAAFILRGIPGVVSPGCAAKLAPHRLQYLRPIVDCAPQCGQYINPPRVIATGLIVLTSRSFIAYIIAYLIVELSLTTTTAGDKFARDRSRGRVPGQPARY